MEYKYDRGSRDVKMGHRAVTDKDASSGYFGYYT
jgi:hypothetical protein